MFHRRSLTVRQDRDFVARCSIIKDGFQTGFQVPQAPFARLPHTAGCLLRKLVRRFSIPGRSRIIFGPSDGKTDRLRCPQNRDSALGNRSCRSDRRPVCYPRMNVTLRPREVTLKPRVVNLFLGHGPFSNVKYNHGPAGKKRHGLLFII